VGIDNVLNQKKSAKMAHFSLFECIENYEVAKAKLLLDTSVNWLKERDIDIIRGSVSPTGTDDDEYKGLLINCFILKFITNSSNKGFYPAFLNMFYSWFKASSSIICIIALSLFIHYIFYL